MDGDVAALIAERVRASRRERGLSLGALARAAGIGKGSLSEIENASRNPTIATMYALAGALGVPFAALLADQPGIEVGTPGFSVVLLDSHELGSEAIEVYRLRFAPGAIREADAHRGGVTEHLLVTAGRLRAGPLERPPGPARLAAGESLDWASDVPHVYEALGDDGAEAVLVMRSPLSG